MTSERRDTALGVSAAGGSGGTDRTCPVCETVLDPVRDVAIAKDSFDLVRCPGCGLLCRGALPGAEELAAIYAPEYFRRDGDSIDGYVDYVRDERLHRDLARRRLLLLERLVPAGSRRLLDVGAAAGFFVSEATKRAWSAEGIDVSVEMTSWGRANLDAPVTHGTLGDVTDRTFDAVTMWDYIEHSLDPAGELEQCHELLAPGGVIAISTGDAGSLVARISGSRWHLLTPRHHNFFFSVPTMERLLRRVGFGDVHARHLGASYSLAHLAYKLDRTIRLPGAGIPSRVLDRSRVGALSVPVNLFDIMTVTARKPGAT